MVMLIQCTFWQVMLIQCITFKSNLPHVCTLTHSQVKIHNFVIKTVIPPIFVQNVHVMYIKISYKFHRIPDTQSSILTKVKVNDFLGQPSYMLPHILVEVHI